MKYLPHYDTERYQVESKLIIRKFGPWGYGVYQMLLEIVSQEVRSDNVSEWGMVSKKHSIESLADECFTTPKKLKELLLFCNEHEIFEKKDGRLFYPTIMLRLDEYSKKILNRNKKSGQSRDKVGTKSVKTNKTNKTNKTTPRVNSSPSATNSLLKNEKPYVKAEEMRPISEILGKKNMAIACFVLISLLYSAFSVPKVTAATIQTVYTIEIKQNYRLPARPTAKEGKVAQRSHNSSPIPSPVAKTKWDEFMEIAPRLAKQYDIPLSVMVGQAALESARGTSYRAIYQNNFFGLGAYHDGAVGMSYDTVEDCIRYYAELIATEPRYAEAYRLRDNPTAMLRAIKKAGYAEDPHYVAKVTSMPEFRQLKINQ